MLSHLRRKYVLPPILLNYEAAKRNLPNGETPVIW